MVDKYTNFEALARSEQEGKDFSIKYQDRGSGVLLMGPHAGEIEPGTSEVVLAIAGNDLSYYLFEGNKFIDNTALHITSTKYDEPRALSMAGNCDSVVTLHGERSENVVVYLGGRNQALKASIEYSLSIAGFATAKHDNPRLQGESELNICNRSATKSGVQLELGKGLRKQFFGSMTTQGRTRTTADLERFAHAVREGLKLPD